jgi:hypothetical protein
MKTIKILSAILFSIALVSCGSGGGGSSTSSTGGLSAYVSKAPVTGATCILRDSAGNTVSTVTSTNGQATFVNIPSVNKNTWMSIKCTGGTYTDEATQNMIDLTPSATIMRTMFVYDGNATVNEVLTPLTEVAYQQVINNGGVYQDFPVYLGQVSTVLGLRNVDVTNLQPTDINKTSVSTNANGQYGAILAVLSQMMKDNPTAYPNIATLMTTLAANIHNGELSPAVKADMMAAMSNVNTNPNIYHNLPFSLTGSGGILSTNLTNGNAVGPLTVIPSQPVNCVVKVWCSRLVATAKGGAPLYHFQSDTFMNGTPPPGMGVDLNGNLSGTPSLAGTYTFGVCAVDMAAASSCTQTTITVSPATPTCSNGATNYPTCTPTGGNGDWYYHWNCNGDSACLGLTPNDASTGSLDEGPAYASCSPLLTFAAHFWNTPPATNSCTQTP